MNCFKVYSFIAVNYHYTSRIRHVGIYPYLFFHVIFDMLNRLGNCFHRSTARCCCTRFYPLHVAVAPVSRSVLFDFLPVKNGILGGMSSLACVPLSLKIIARKYYNLVVANMNYVMTKILS